MTQTLDNLNKKELLELAQALQVLDIEHKYNKQKFLFTEQDIVPWSLYKKHQLFVEAGVRYRERALIAGNRTGKTRLATGEASFHLNGRYHDNWKGKRFNGPIKAWAAGKTHLATRDTLQVYLLGERYDLGTGMIPKEDIIRTTTKSGTQDGIQDVYIRHYDVNGIEDGVSELTFKSYDQGLESFMGWTGHLVLLDEEPTHPNIYSECITRTMTTNGSIICTFTPLSGLSETVLTFLPSGKFPPGGIGEVHNES